VTDSVLAVGRTGPWVLVALFCLLAAAPAASAQGVDPLVQPYQTNDGKGFHDVLPPGTNGLVNAPEAAAFLGAGQRPAHSDDQLGMYAGLRTASPSLNPADLERFYKDSSFGVKPDDIDRTYHPGGRDGAVVVRDKRFGVPHVYARTRSDAMFALGYVTAEDRLFFIDVLRHLGRAQLTSFAGGAKGNQDFDVSQWENAPYTEEDLQRQIDLGDEVYGAEGAQLQGDLEQYTAGVNAYIDEAKLDPTKMPAEYAAIGQPLGPEAWKGTDAIAIASLVGGIFGKGGGRELPWGELLQGFQQKFGAGSGRALWEGFRSANDPEAPTTVQGKGFKYELVPRKVDKGSRALPDKGSVTPVQTVESASGTGVKPHATVEPKSDGLGLSGLFKVPTANSNALLVAGKNSASGHPLAVFGPQVAYFNPEILMEQDVHAPSLDARGAAFPGVNLYVELGRGRDYAWSATSAGQDIIDTFAVPLCQDDVHYMFRGQCLPMETLRRTNSWSPNVADSTPAGSVTLRADRTKMGVVIARGKVGGQPVAYTNLRSTYFHEVDSARGFSDLNNPDLIHGPEDFKHAAYKIGYTFNWFYADDRDIAYFNSGNNPVRSRRIDPELPVASQYEWRNFNPDLNIADYTPEAAHPQVVNQDFITSWNNKQAPLYAGADTNTFSPVYRSQPLDDGIRSRLAGGKKMTLTGLVDAMEDAATIDLRGNKVLPWALRVLGTPKDPALADAVAKLTAWQKEGAHRIDRDGDGHYEHADAIRIMDAWWPRWIKAEFEPTLGGDLFNGLQALVTLDNSPNNHGDHLGSAYQDGWYGFAQKDLRRVLGRSVRGAYPTRYCGGPGSRRTQLARCRSALEASLADALRNDDPATLYKDDACASGEGAGMDPQTCYDAIRFRPLGAVTQPLIPWQNRPTYQQADEIQSHRPR
jgi:acyl-homoserine lactone acylase PvdQ